MSTYRQIACNYYDILESIATLKEMAIFIYEDESGQRITKKARISDIFSKNKEEFILLDDQTLIRLDRILMVNETWFGLSC